MSTCENVNEGSILAYKGTQGLYLGQIFEICTFGNFETLSASIICCVSPFSLIYLFLVSNQRVLLMLSENV